jgi:hypothetical protein
MPSEVITAIIVAISTIAVAWLQHRNNADTKKLRDDIGGLKDEKGIADLKAEKQKVFDKREETYNELTVAIAQHLVYKTPVAQVETKLCECIAEDSKLKEATAKYINEIQKWIKD